MRSEKNKARPARQARRRRGAGVQGGGGGGGDRPSGRTDPAAVGRREGESVREWGAASLQGRAAREKKLECEPLVAEKSSQPRPFRVLQPLRDVRAPRAAHARSRPAPPSMCTWAGVVSPRAPPESGRRDRGRGRGGCSISSSTPFPGQPPALKQKSIDILTKQSRTGIHTHAHTHTRTHTHTHTSLSLSDVITVTHTGCIHPRHPQAPPRTPRPGRPATP
jgi:hypothetical protein